MKNYALIGNPIHQSPTPAIMNDLFRMNGVDAFYTALQLPLGSSVMDVHWLFDGFNVTYPFKREIGGNVWSTKCGVESTDGKAFFLTIPSVNVIAIKGITGGTALSIIRLVKSMGIKVVRWTTNEKADIYLNATPCDIEFDMPVEANRDVLIYDLHYGESKFLESAKKAGFKTKDGKEMLVWNSILSFQKFVGRAPSEESRDHVFKKYGGST